MTATCGNRYRDAVGAALDCDLPPGHDGEHASRTTPDTTYRWSAALGEPRPAPQPTADASAPDRDRTRLLHLLGRLRDGRLLTAEVDLLANAVTALADARDRDRRFLTEARRLRDEACERLDAHQLAMANALGFGPNTAWDTLRERAETAVAAAYERADLLEAARDALSAAGQNGPHGDDWPAITPGIEALAAERDAARADNIRACETIADMLAAATGRHGEGPVRGVVEDVADVRAEMLATRAGIGDLRKQLSESETAAHALLKRAERAEAELRGVRNGGLYRQIRHTANYPLPADATDADRAVQAYARSLERWVPEAALDGEQPAEQVRCCVCGTTDVAPRGYGTQRYCWPCTLKETFAEPEPTEPRPLVISIDLNGADIANLIRRAFRTPGSPT